MKTWNEPSIEELMINETAGGDPTITEHDGTVIWTRGPEGNPIPSEEYGRRS